MLKLKENSKRRKSGGNSLAAEREWLQGTVNENACRDVNYYDHSFQGNAFASFDCLTAAVNDRHRYSYAGHNESTFQ